MWPQAVCVAAAMHASTATRASTATHASTSIHAATLPCPVDSCTNTGVGKRKPQGGRRRQSPCLLLLARLPKYFHRMSNLNPWQPGYSELYKTQEHNKPQAPSILSGEDGCSELNARLGVLVTVSTGLPGSSKQRSCSALPERLTSYCSL